MGTGTGWAGPRGFSSDRRLSLPVDCLSLRRAPRGRVRFVRRLTVNLELVRTRGIRLSN